jgi:hypothetical protein
MHTHVDTVQQKIHACILSSLSSGCSNLSATRELLSATHFHPEIQQVTSNLCGGNMNGQYGPPYVLCIGRHTTDSETHIEEEGLVAFEEQQMELELVDLEPLTKIGSRRSALQSVLPQSEARGPTQ